MAYPCLGRTPGSSSQNTGTPFCFLYNKALMCFQDSLSPLRRHTSSYSSRCRQVSLGDDLDTTQSEGWGGLENKELFGLESNGIPPRSFAG